MPKDVTYTNGVIAVREQSLLRDKISKLCEGTAEEAFRILSDSGFGKGAEAISAYEYERLLSADEAELDEFIREYAPTNAEREYLLSPRDFHNAKAAVKAQYLNLSAEEAAPMLAPDGIYTVEQIMQAVQSGDTSALNTRLAEAISAAAELFGQNSEGETPKDVAGAEVGIIFDKALFAHLAKVCRTNLFLKRCAATRADMTNILTALRSQTPEYAAANYVTGGTLKEKQLASLFNENGEINADAIDGTRLERFLKLCIKQKAAGLPMTEAERGLDSLEARLLSERKYELKNKQPFLYYVFRRRAENANLRIVFACLLAGMDERRIKSRLREY